MSQFDWNNIFWSFVKFVQLVRKNAQLKFLPSFYHPLDLVVLRSDTILKLFMMFIEVLTWPYAYFTALDLTIQCALKSRKRRVGRIKLCSISIRWRTLYIMQPLHITHMTVIYTPTYRAIQTLTWWTLVKKAHLKKEKNRRDKTCLHWFEYTKYSDQRVTGVISWLVVESNNQNGHNIVTGVHQPCMPTLIV